MSRTPASNPAAMRPVEPLGHKTAKGMTWMVSQSLATKVISTIGTLVLGKLLLDSAFGLAALAYAFSVIPVLIQQGGLREILVQRHHQFRRWANPAFFMSIAQGLGAGVLMACLAPLCTWKYNDPQLMGLLLLLAVAFPVDALNILPQANLQNQMRFRFLAALELGKIILQTGLSILFAKLGFGAYSLLLPRVIVSAASALVCWFAAPVPLRWKPQFRRWHFLSVDSGLVFVGNACTLVIMYADYFILSCFRDVGEVGQYFFAFNLSLQTIYLLTQNLGAVLFPALSKLQDDPARQVAGFLRAMRLMAFLTLPACLGQAAVAAPLLHIVYGDKWDAAIPLLQLLSIGMAMRTIGWPAVSLLNAQGRFAARMWLSVISLAAFVGMVTIGAWKFGALGVAWAVTLHMLVLEPLHLLVAIRPAGRGVRDAAAMLIGPVVVGAGSIVPAWFAAECLPTMAHREWWRAATVFAVSGLLYVPLLRLVARDAWDEGISRMHQILGPKLATFSGLSG